MLGRGKVQREEAANAEVLEQEHGNRGNWCSWRRVNERAGSRRSDGAGSLRLRWSDALS